MFMCPGTRDAWRVGTTTRRRDIRSRGSDGGWDRRETRNWVTRPLGGLGVGLVLGARRTWGTQRFQIQTG